MNLSNLNIKIKYQSLNDNPLEDFYIPVLSQSVIYKRAVGYFSSKILLDYTRGLREFVKNNGKIQLVISPYLSNEDINQMRSVFDSNDYFSRLNEMFNSYLEDKQVFASGKLLFMLMKLNKMEIKVAVPMNEIGLFHDKIGIFSDSNHNKIAIIGSNNETSSSVKVNMESFNTFCSWKTGQTEYIHQHEKDFDNYWNGNNQNIKLYDIKDALNEDLIQLFNTDEELDELLSQILVQKSIEDNKKHIYPRDYQIQAVENWMLDKQGIFKMATGTGKTKTAIYLMEELETLRSKNFFIIVVPDKTLVNQWNDELESYDKHTVRCFSDNKDWHIQFHNLIDVSAIKEHYNYYIIVTNDSYLTSKFQRELKLLNNDYLLVVDECHTWGTENILSILPSPVMRLGLSATPELFFSAEKTTKLLEFFGGIVFEYSLERAIKDGKLVEYKYFPYFVNLTESEKDEYRELTQKIVRMIGYDTNESSDSVKRYGNALEMILFKRSRIIYGASNKLNKLSEIVMDLEKKGNLLIYCGPTSYTSDLIDEIENESLSQLQIVNKILGSLNIKFAQYTSKESAKEREIAKENFKKQIYSTLIAIKCLDEGVDIPQIERAIILASSTNPREFVQRRGRILRPSFGKEYAEIHDFIVSDDEFPLLNKRELARLYEFGRIAINSREVLEQYKDLIELYSLNKRDNNE